MSMQERIISRPRTNPQPDQIMGIVPSIRSETVTQVLGGVDIALSQIDSVLDTAQAGITSPFSADSGTDLRQINALQTQWDTVLGTSREKGEFENYNPVLARWGWDRLETDEQRQLFRVNEIRNITTALRERNQTSESRLTLTIGSDKKLHNEVFPDGSYEDVLERGREYRAENGSSEMGREQAELDGFQKLQARLTADETEIGTKVFIISGPGFAKDTPYTHNFVDGFELVEDQLGNRSVEYTRYASPLGYEKYHEFAEGIDAEYFDRQDGGVDAWYLANPIVVPGDATSQSMDDVFADYFARDVKAMEEKEWQMLDSIYLPYKLFLLDQLTKEDFDPVAIAEAYNALLLSTEDKDMQNKNRETDIFIAPHVTELSLSENKHVAAMVELYGRRDVKEVKAGCGSSSGFSFGGEGKSNATFSANSVSQFGTGSSVGTEWFNCPQCSYKASGPVGDTCPGCRLTKEDFAEKSGATMCD